MNKVSDLFYVEYGVNLELNSLEKDANGINFVSRTSQNNGVSARVKRLPHIEPIPAGTITVAGGGSVMESFLQTEPYYSGRDLYYLTPKFQFTEHELLFYCVCLRANKYRFNYGRQANRTLRDILIPSPSEIPEWVNLVNLDAFNNANKSTNENSLEIKPLSQWKEFTFDELFDIKKGKRLTKANMRPGITPFIGSIDKNNGLSHTIGQQAIHDGNTITVNYNGSVAEAFYQPVSFWASDDVNVLYPKFELNSYIAMFLITVIRNEKYRFSYGRKWHVERMKTSTIKLPAIGNCADWHYMENYIKLLPFSSQL